MFVKWFWICKALSLMDKDGDGLFPEPLSPQGAASLSQFLEVTLQMNPSVDLQGSFCPRSPVKGRLSDILTVLFQVHTLVLMLNFHYPWR